MNNKKKTRVILASASERRQSLLKTVIPEFSVYVTDTDETVCKTLTPTELVEELSRRKAFNAARNIAAAEGEDILIIAADTVVSIGGVILGKPADSDDARRMLDLLNGKWHEVCTGLTLTDGTHVDTQTVSQVTRVKFRDVPDDELERYIATGSPLDKAGAYGIQDSAALVEAIDGDYHNVMGLPILTLTEMLADRRSKEAAKCRVIVCSE